MLDLSGIEGQTEVTVNTDEGLVKAKLAALPFDFAALGMQAHAK